MAKIIAVCTSEKKGMRKKNIGKSKFIKDLGLENDAHAGFKHRQVSLLAMESIDKMKSKGLDVGPGDFAENLTTTGVNLVNLPIGTRIKIGSEAILRVTQIGKECHSRCAIYEQAGDCVMPREGIFAEVLLGGPVSVENKLEIVSPYSFAVITASDKGYKGERKDDSGPLIEGFLSPWGDITEYSLLPDDYSMLVRSFKKMAKSGIHAIFTTGGTGLSPRDITPEATLEVCDKMVPGIPEAIRHATSSKTEKAMLSRAVAGICGSTLIINLPGSPKAVLECLEVLSPVLQHALETLTGKSENCADTEERTSDKKQ